jgi:hypothetical protein
MPCGSCPTEHRARHRPQGQEVDDCCEDVDVDDARAAGVDPALSYPRRPTSEFKRPAAKSHNRAAQWARTCIKSAARTSSLHQGNA